MQRRTLDIICVQETEWKGNMPRSLGAGFKLLYDGVTEMRNGLGV